MFQEEIARIRKLGVQGVSDHIPPVLLPKFRTDVPVAAVPGPQLLNGRSFGPYDVEGAMSCDKLGVAYRGCLVVRPQSSA